MDEKMNQFFEKIKNVSGSSIVIANEYMSRHTTFKSGGPADIFITPDSVESVKAIIDTCKDNDVDYFIIGRGSNLLVGDKGFTGVIICIYNCLDNIEVISEDENSLTVKAGAGIMLGKLSMTVSRKGFAGMEFASGIPGTLGGGVAMNAGAYGGEIKDCIVSATVIDDNMNVVTLTKEELKLGYRSSIVKDRNFVVLDAAFRLVKGDKEQIMANIEDFNSRRRDKQPLEFPSAGSTFKRPAGYFAGKLIEDSGLAGYRVGGACVSTKHCGFVVNDKEGTSADILQVINDVKSKVKDKFGVELEPEVRMIGNF